MKSFGLCMTKETAYPITLKTLTLIIQISQWKKHTGSDIRAKLLCLKAID
jgi:hypothetical protein